MAGYILLKKEYSTVETRIWLKFRSHYLKSQKLICAYCGKKDLKLNSHHGRNLGSLATIDHIIPLSKGGSRFDRKNLTVACHTCNNKKGNKI